MDGDDNPEVSADVERPGDERPAPLGTSAVADLRRRFRGMLLQPGEDGYPEARQVWNARIDRRPALIARCAGADDVRTALRFARDHQLPLSVRAAATPWWAMRSRTGA